MRASGLVQPLVSDRLDLIGDVHGELDALRALLARLGCDTTRCTVERPIVFVGDLIDRGPDSVAVVMLVQRLVEAGVAQVVLGNHELNLLVGDQKEGNGWFLPHQRRPDAWHDGKDHIAFACRQASAEERTHIRSFLRTLPVALESPELRVVHADWSPDALQHARAAPSLDAFIAPLSRDVPLHPLDGAPTREDLTNPLVAAPFHEGLAAKMVAEQNSRPVKVLTSGVERPIARGTLPRWLSGKWRLLERDPWWEHDDDARPVVFGHYWRRRSPAQGEGADPFRGIAPTAWFGARKQAFCVDFSVGYRFKARHVGEDPHRRYGLAALRWPERVLVFDDEDAPLPTTR